MTKDLDNITTSTLRRSNFKFSKPFLHKLFYLWYELGQPNGPDFFNHLSPEDRFDVETGKHINKNWITNQIANWRPSAYEMDQQVFDQLRQKAVGDRVELLQRQIPEFQELQEMSLKFLREKGMGSSRNAITAYFKAAAQERLARGVPIEEYEDISGLDEAQILDLLTRLAGEEPLDLKDTKEQISAT